MASKNVEMPDRNPESTGSSSYQSVQTRFGAHTQPALSYTSTSQSAAGQGDTSHSDSEAAVIQEKEELEEQLKAANQRILNLENECQEAFLRYENLSADSEFRLQQSDRNLTAANNRFLRAKEDADERINKDAREKARLTGLLNEARLELQQSRAANAQLQQSNRDVHARLVRSETELDRRNREDERRRLEEARLQAAAEAQRAAEDEARRRTVPILFPSGERGDYGTLDELAQQTHGYMRAEVHEVQANGTASEPFKVLASAQKRERSFVVVAVHHAARLETNIKMSALTSVWEAARGRNIKIEFIVLMYRLGRDPVNSEAALLRTCADAGIPEDAVHGVELYYHNRSFIADLCAPAFQTLESLLRS